MGGHGYGYVRTGVVETVRSILFDIYLRGLICISTTCLCFGLQFSHPSPIILESISSVKSVVQYI
jgi:hypothetical protein